MVANPKPREEDDMAGELSVDLTTALVLTRNALPIETRVVWDELVAFDKTNLREVFTRALGTYWTQRLTEEAHNAYEALRDDPSALAAYEKECAELDGTLMDGLDDDDA